MSHENAKGRIYDIQGYAVHDGPGIRTTIFTKGCPLRCLWCHSPESQFKELELGYLPIKCIGMDICNESCINACPNGAISKSQPEQALDGSGYITKAEVDRTKCSNCLKCTQTCTTSALYSSGRDAMVDEVFERVNKDRIFFRNGGGITISGGEPMSQFEFTFNLAKKLKESGLHICLDTTGHAAKEQFREIMPFIDLFLYDIKHMDSSMHKRLTGVGNETILQNARFLADNGAALQIRIPIIPKLTDSKENLEAAAEFCVSLGDAIKLVQLLPYHATGRMKYDRLGWKYKITNIDPPDEEYMHMALEMFKSHGLNCQLY